MPCPTLPSPSPYRYLLSENEEYDSKNLHGALSTNCISAIVIIDRYQIYLQMPLLPTFSSLQTGVLNPPIIHIGWPLDTGVRSAFPIDS